MRPPSIVRFEQAVYASLGLSLVNSLIWSDTDTASSPGIELPLSHLIGLHVVALGISVLLIWLIARRASNIAKWIFVALSGLSLALQLASPEWIFEMGGVETAILLSQDLLIIIALRMLFRSDSRAWFNGTYSGPYGDVFG
jgi:hypothetical protein